MTGLVGDPVEIVRQLDEQLWREFVDGHPLSNVYHTPEMYQVFSRVEGHRPTLWAAVDDSQRPLALLLPVQITLKGGLLRPLTTRSVVYGSALSDEGGDALGRLLEAYVQETKGVLFTELRNLSDLNEIQSVLNGCRFAYEDHLNYLIDLDQPEEVIWGKISKSGRQGVRTSRNKGTVVEEVTDKQQVANVYRLLQQVYARVHVPLASPGLFEAAFDVLVPLGMFKIFVARLGERFIAACVLLIYKERIIYWYAGADRAFSSYTPGELLIWHALQWGKGHNFRLFDLGGAGRPDQDYGPRRFKAKFGGELVNYGRNTCIHSPAAFYASQTVYHSTRRFLFRRQT